MGAEGVPAERGAAEAIDPHDPFLCVSLNRLRAVESNLSRRAALAPGALRMLREVIADLESLVAAPQLGDPLDEREAAVLKYVVGFLVEHGYQPSVREIGSALGLRSTKSVTDAIAGLVEKGYLSTNGSPGGARSLGVVGLRLRAVQTLVPSGTAT